MPDPSAASGELGTFLARAASEQTSPQIALSPEDQAALRRAVQDLENESFVSRLSTVAGSPMAILGRALPDTLSEAISMATSKSLDRKVVEWPERG